MSWKSLAVYIWSCDMKTQVSIIKVGYRDIILVQNCLVTVILPCDGRLVLFSLYNTNRYIFLNYACWQEKASEIQMLWFFWTDNISYHSLLQFSLSEAVILVESSILLVEFEKKLAQQHLITRTDSVFTTSPHFSCFYFFASVQKEECFSNFYI